jgi:hypothetical protein
MIATLWVAAGSHCRLEILPGFEFLSCCQHPDDEKSPTHHEKECGDDGCATIELGLYHQSKPQSAPVKAVLAMVVWSMPLSVNCPACNSDSLASASSSLPELARYWQFFQRTALPPRAPSFVS